MEAFFVNMPEDPDEAAATAAILSLIDTLKAVRSDAARVRELLVDIDAYLNLELPIEPGGSYHERAAELLGRPWRVVED